MSAALVLAACSATLEETLGSFRTETVRLPDTAELCARMSAGGSRFAGWELVYVDAGGAERSAFVAAGSTEIRLKLPSGIPSPVLAQPLFERTAEDGTVQRLRFFKPAGCVYPHGTSLSWQHGFSAAVLRAVYRTEAAAGTSAPAQSVCSMFNWPRLLERVAQEERPWQLDRERLVSAISAQKFSASSVKLAECVSVAAEDLLESAKNTVGIYGGTADNEVVLLSDYVPDEIISAQSRQSVTVLKNVPVQFFLPSQNSIIAVEFD